MRFLRLLPWLLPLAGCIGRYDVNMEVEYAADARSDVVELYMFAAGDKLYSPVLEPGDSTSGILWPEDSEPTPIVLFKIDGKQYSWEGARVPAHTGYNIRIRIAADGSVKARQCVRPCNLPRD